MGTGGFKAVFDYIYNKTLKFPQCISLVAPDFKEISLLFSHIQNIILFGELKWEFTWDYSYLYF